LLVVKFFLCDEVKLLKLWKEEEEDNDDYKDER
jgi:hypothetical protein